MHRAIIEPIWRSPLVPVALAATVGVVLDRWFGLPVISMLLAALVAITASLAFAHYHRSLLALPLLWTAVGTLGAAYHHWHRDVHVPDDISYFASEERRPALVRGVVDTEPMLINVPARTSCAAFPPKTAGVLC